MGPTWGLSYRCHLHGWSAAWVHAQLLIVLWLQGLCVDSASCVRQVGRGKAAARRGWMLPVMGDTGAGPWFPGR